MKNFIYLLVDYMNQLELAYPVKIGIFDNESSLMIKPVEGSQIIHEYMNGMADIRLLFELSIKNKDQEVAYNVLSEVIEHFKDLQTFLNRNESREYLLLNLEMDQIPVFQESKDGYFYYTTKITVELTVT